MSSNIPKSSSISPSSSPTASGVRIAQEEKDVADPQLEKEYLESVRKDSAKGRTLTSVGGGLLLAAGTTLVNPLLAIPAAIVGIGAGYKMYKERERSRVESAEKLLATGDHAAENIPGEEGSSRPPLRRLIFLVRWASLQVATDLDNGDLKPLRLERVFDETILSFSAWVQKIYTMRAERSKHKREQELRLLKLHLSPLVRWLGSSPSNEIFMMVNYEFSKELFAILKNDSRNLDTPRIIRRCRSVFPIVVEVYQLFHLGEDSKLGQLVLWITDFLRTPSVSSMLADSLLRAPKRMQTAVSVQFDDNAPSEPDLHVEFPPLGVEQELEDDEYYSASEGEDHEHSSVISRAAATATSVPLTISPSKLGGVPEELLFQKAKGSGDTSNCWSDLDATELNIRGANYLVDKIKTHSLGSMFEMLCFDLFYTDHPIYCVSRNKHCRAYWLLKDDPNLFLFTVNWRLQPMQATVTFGIRKDTCSWLKSDCPERVLLERFLDGTPAMRNEVVKVIPKVTEGPWLVRKAVGQTPAILGRKLKVDYHEEPGRFIECEYDVLSTTAAKSMIGLVVGAAKRLVIDVGIVLEAKESDELPERILGGFRIHFPDLSTCRRIVLGAPVPPPHKPGCHVHTDSDDNDF